MPGADSFSESALPFAVETFGLTKLYGRTAAVSNLDLRVRRGTFFGFLGPNGAGKSTTIKMLSGLVLPTSGRAIVAGHDVVAEPLLVKASIGVLPEDASTYERLTARELLTFTGRMRALPRAEVERRSKGLLDLMEFAESDRDKLVVDFSTGMKKKIALATALVGNPRVLFLDEPFNGIDAVTARSIRKALQDLTQKGVTILFSSHVLELVEKLCTEIAILNRGVLCAQGSLADIRAALSLSPDASLEDAFVSVAGAREPGETDLSWIG